MPRLPLSGGIALGILASALLAGCGLDDLFQAPGPADGVVFVLHNDSDTVFVDDTIPLVIAVVAAGDTLPAPRLAVASLNTARLVLTPAGDQMIGIQQGIADLEVRLLASVITGPGPDTILRVRVRN